MKELGALHLRHAQFLRSVILISGAHPEVYRRGAGKRRALAARFHILLGRLCDRAGDRLIETAFTAVFSTLSMRISYGPDFTPLAVDDEALLNQLAAMAVAYLLQGQQHPPAARLPRPEPDGSLGS